MSLKPLIGVIRLIISIDIDLLFYTYIYFLRLLSPPVQLSKKIGLKNFEKNVLRGLMRMYT